MKDRIRNMCFTLNNYTQEEYDKLWNEKSNYTILGKETCPNTGTPHIQGYIEFKNPRYFKALKKVFPRLHMEEREGTSQRASNYCKKGKQSKEEWKEHHEEGPNFGMDAIFEEKGELSNQGKRTDLHRIADMVLEQEPLRNIAITYPRDYIKFHKGITALKNILKTHRTSKPTCYWFYGPTGVGKTYTATKLGSSYFIKNSTKWWDGYEQQEVVVIDDFRKDNVPLDTLLRWMDEYECTVEVKGSSLPLNSPIIVITCDVGPHEYWQDNDLDQLQRRLNGGVRYIRQKEF